MEVYGRIGHGGYYLLQLMTDCAISAYFYVIISLSYIKKFHIQTQTVMKENAQKT